MTYGQTECIAGAMCQPINNGDLTLKDWHVLIDTLKEEFGEDARFFADAGANNVTMYVQLQEAPKPPPATAADVLHALRNATHANPKMTIGELISEAVKKHAKMAKSVDDITDVGLINALNKMR